MSLYCSVRYTVGLLYDKQWMAVVAAYRSHRTLWRVFCCPRHDFSSSIANMRDPTEKRQVEKVRGNEYFFC
jgi:hypothetical protein